MIWRVSSFNPRFQGTHFVRERLQEFDRNPDNLSIPVFRGLILLAAIRTAEYVLYGVLSIPVFRGLILLAIIFGGGKIDITDLSIPVFRGLILLVDTKVFV